MGARAVGTFRSGTSGFAYDAWAPRFYPTGTHPAQRLRLYSARLRACELNNTFYRRPSREQLRAWRDSIDADFRLVVKAQRGASFRAMHGDPGGSVGWLTESLDELGPSLGAVLFRVPADVRRDDGRLAALLEAWPPAVPLVVELQDRSWHADETFAALRRADAVLCATDLDDDPAPDIRVTGRFVYARLRRSSYDAVAIDAWAARLSPFLAAGLDAYAFLRHDDDGASALAAEALAAAVARRLEAEAGA